MILIWALFLHFIADFVLQPRDMAKNKTSDLKILRNHIFRIISIIGLGLLPFLTLDKVMILTLVNGLIHGVIDWNIWKIYKHFAYKRASKLALPETFAYWDDVWFYCTIGLDQFLHAATLVALFYWLC